LRGLMGSIFILEEGCKKITSWTRALAQIPSIQHLKQPINAH
jgi:hypothetical protein